MTCRATAAPSTGRAARVRAAAVALWLGPLTVGASAPVPDGGELERAFATTVRPFLRSYCVVCHQGQAAQAQLDLGAYSSLAEVVRDHRRWAVVHEKLSANQMPPEQARQIGLPQPTPEERRTVVDWIDAMRRQEARRTAGDPGLVLARRLSNAEYDYTIRDLTGVDIRPAREFPVDPANPAGFDNSGESLAMSPALVTKYLQAAREVTSHLVLGPGGIAFAPHPMLVETDRDRYCVERIVGFYRRQPTDLAAYFRAAWAYKHRAALGRPGAALEEVAAAGGVSPRYLKTIWRALEESREDVGPLARVQALWRGLPVPAGDEPELAREGSEAMRNFVVALRGKVARRHADLEVEGIRRTAQPFLMWRNRRYAEGRRGYDAGALQVEGEVPVAAAHPATPAKGADAADEDAAAPASRPSGPDPDLRVPAGQRERYEQAFARFAAVFPDAFYVSERGRYFPDDTRDKGRHLSAGFHNLMGYFRDDGPLYELILDEEGRRELDALWQDLEFVASASARTFVQFYLNESARVVGSGDGPAAAPPEEEITSEATIRRVAESYLAKARSSGNAAAVQAIQDHFESTNAAIRRVENARVEAEPGHLRALEAFAARAYRRPLSQAERTELREFYRSLREEAGLAHDEALRDAVVGVLMSPDFCYRFDLAQAGEGARPLSDHALASRLSYFLWSSLPDAELLAHAAAGELHRPEVLVRQARRMLRDDRVRGLAVEFGASWLNFRRFEEHNAVDRERFPVFDDELRQAMFEEPIRFMLDVFREDRSVLDFLYADHTFIDPALARLYGMEDGGVAPGTWRRVDGASRYGRGGLLPMAVFLTRNAPGLRTSPVKRGYWVVKEVLGERIPPPPPVVPELPRDEATLDVPLREALSRHRRDPACAGCHARFDSFGLVFEGYGPVGERRDVDLAGRPVDASATFPGGASGRGVEGLRDYLRTSRQDDFVSNLCGKLLAFALGRSLSLSDEPAIEAMRAALARDGYRFHGLVESIVTSPQFLNKRGRDDRQVAAR